MFRLAHCSSRSKQHDCNCKHQLSHNAPLERKPPSPSQPGQLALCWWLEVECLPFGSPHSLRNEWRCEWLEPDPQPQTYRAAAVDSFLRKCRKGTCEICVGIYILKVG